jgi:hypothetical protein
MNSDDMSAEIPDASSVVNRLHRHRLWANAQLLASARGLPAEDLRQPFPVGQGSVWASLLHLYAADRMWLNAFEGTPRTDPPAEFGSLAQLAAAWAGLDGRWRGSFRASCSWRCRSPAAGRWA